MWSFLKQYLWVADILGVIISAYLLAQLAGLYLEGKLEVTRSIAFLENTEIEISKPQFIPEKDYVIIVERNIFDSTAVQTEGDTTNVPSKSEVDLTGEAVKTSLSIKVLGVLVIGAGIDPRSSATISSGKGKAGVYSVGDVNGFAQDTKLTKVAPNRIEFVNGGRLEYAEVTTDFGKSIFARLDETKVAAKGSSKETVSAVGVKSETPGKYVIDQKEVDNALSNLDKLYTQIRAVPNFSGGKVSGMKILSVRRGSIFAKLGLKRGDILKQINGMELDVRRGFQIFGQLKDQQSFNVDLIRRGQPLTLEYEIR